MASRARLSVSSYLSLACGPCPLFLSLKVPFRSLFANSPDACNPCSPKESSSWWTDRNRMRRSCGSSSWGFTDLSNILEVAANLAEAVRAVEAGRIWISNEQMNMYMHRKVKAEHGSTEEPSFPTARETEILQLIRQRFSNPEIAEILQLSVHTVKCHVSHILSKCCVASRRELETRAQLGPSRIWEQLGGAGSKPRHLTK